jgi:UDP-N-acetyl-D-glucosamine dehydrogenase
VNPMPLIERFRSREAMIGVVGLGYVGLPLVRELCNAGFRVIGFDIDPRKTEALNRGESYIRHIPSDLVADFVNAGRFEATANFDRAGEPDAVLICVPTPLTESREPDLSYVEATARSLASRLRPGQLIVLESSTYPGTTDEVLCPLLAESGLMPGADFLVAYSPEREDPGNPTFSTGKIPKVVGGCDANALAAAQALYDQFVVRTVPVSSARSAEAVKLLENIFRSVNIALVNELKTIYAEMDIDVWEVIEAAKTKPFGYMPFYPGPGLGGHCIPIDPFYLSWKARQYGLSTRFIELAGEINTQMPEYVLSVLEGALAEQGKTLAGSTVLVLGVAYKKDVADPRESPGINLIDMLRKRGAKTLYSDPYIPRLPELRKYDLDMESAALTPETLAACDAAIVVTDHSTFDYAAIVRHAPLVIDTRNATAAFLPAPNVRKA